jgi:hypothetical protein
MSMLVRALVLGLVLSPAVACAGGEKAPVERPGSSAEPVEFSFFAPDGTRFDSASTRGRVTAILLLTTYDLNSQVVARRLNEVLRSFKPRFNAGAVVLEPSKYAVFLEPFKQSLGLRYPVVLADQATLQGDGALGGGVEVPTLVVLDAQGRPLWRLSGPATEQQIRSALEAAQAPSGK